MMKTRVKLTLLPIVVIVMVVIIMLLELQEMNETSNNLPYMDMAGNVGQLSYRVGQSFDNVGYMKVGHNGGEDENINENKGLKTLLVAMTERSDTCNHCFKRDYKFSINSPDVCLKSSGEKDVELMIVVSSAPDRREQRDVLRRTWTSVTRNNTWPRARYLFLLGHSRLDAEIQWENELYGDIAMQTFTDSYHNLTLKTLMGMQWFVTFCPHARHFMKTDDDVLVNIPNILRLIHHPSYNVSHVHGRCHAMKKPQRDPRFKWYTPISIYPHSIYPPYCGGYGYIMSAKITREVLSASPNILFLMWEDAYVGLCLDHLRVKVRMVIGFRVRVFRGVVDECSPYNQYRWCIAHGYKHANLTWVWHRCILPDLRKDPMVYLE